jgi:hypothetical protein
MHTIIMVNNLTNELVHIVLFMFQLFDHLIPTLTASVEDSRNDGDFTAQFGYVWPSFSSPNRLLVMIYLTDY